MNKYPLFSEILGVDIQRKNDVFFVSRKTRRTVFPKFRGEYHVQVDDKKSIPTWELWIATVVLRRMLENLTCHLYAANTVLDEDKRVVGYFVIPVDVMGKYPSRTELMDFRLDLIGTAPEVGNLGLVFDNRYRVPRKYRWRTLRHLDSRRPQWDTLSRRPVPDWQTKRVEKKARKLFGDDEDD